MDVSKIKNSANQNSTLNQVNKTAASNNQQKTADSLAGARVVATTDNNTNISPEKRKTIEKNNSRSELNRIIDVVNLADEATSDIEKIVHSLGGIVEQVDGKDISAERRQKLEEEANQLVSEISKKAQSSSNGVQPLKGQEIRMELEQEVGKSLELLIPDDADKSLGIGEINFSKRETILDIRTQVAMAQERVQDIRNSVSSAKDSVKSVVEAFDIAQQNAEASQSTTTDLDRAYELASKTKTGIFSSPELAVNAVGDLKPSAASKLLSQD